MLNFLISQRMKKINFFGALLLLPAAFACQQLAQVDVLPAEPAEAQVGTPIMFYSVAEDASRATAVTSLSTFEVVCENSGTSAQVWSIPSVTKDGNLYHTGKLWPSSDGHFAFYAANVSLTHAAGGPTVSPSTAATDVVVAYTPYDEDDYKHNVPLTFGHIYSRIGTITIVSPTNYTVTVNSLALSAPVGGTYNVRTGAWTATGAAAAQTLSTGANDVYVVPGTYTLTVNYTITSTVDPNYSETLSKSASVTLQQGKVNSITATPPVTSEEIIFTVTVQPWGENSIDVNLS